MNELRNLLLGRNETENQTAIELGYMGPSHIKESNDVSSRFLCATVSGIRLVLIKRNVKLSAPNMR